MAAEQSYARLGFFIVISLIVVFATGLFFLERVRSREVISFVTYTSANVSGLDISSLVRYRGVQIGRVSDIRVAPSEGRVEIDFEIFRDRLISIGASESQVRYFTESLDKLRAQVLGNPITGEAYLLLDFPADPSPGPALGFTPPPNYIASIPSPLSTMQDRLPEVLDRAQATLETLRIIIERMPESLARSDRFMTNIERVLQETEFPALSADLRAFSTTTTAEMKQIRTEIERLAGPDSALARFADEASGVLRDADFPASTKAAQTAAERTTLAADDLRRSLPMMRETLDELRQLARKIDEQPESIVYGPRPAKEKSR